LASAAAAEDGVAQDGTPGLTVAEIDPRLKRVEEAADLDADLKAKLLDSYKQAIDQLKAADEWQHKADTWQLQRQKAPEELKQLKARLDEAHAEPVIDPWADATPADLEQKLADAEAALRKATQQLTDAEAEPKRRRIERPKLLAAAQQRLKETEQELSTLAPAGDALDPGEARRVFLAAIKRATQAELAAYDHERIYYETNTELLTAKQDAAALDTRLAEATVKRYRDVLNELRKDEALKQAEEARRAAVAAMPEVKIVADRNAELTQEQEGPDGLPARIATTEAEVDELRKELADLKVRFTRMRDRIDAAGITEAVGLLLQKQQADLPDLRVHRKRLQARHAEASHVKAKLIELEDQRAELADLEKPVRKVMDTVDPNLLPFERDEIETTLRELLKARQRFLASQINSAEKYLYLLAMDLNVAEQELIDEIDAYKRFISERILWVRSAPTLGLTDIRRGWAGLVELCDRQQALGVLAELGHDARENPWIYVATALFFGPLLAAQRYLRRRIHTIDHKAAQAYAADIRPTLHVVLLTALIASLWPAMIAFLGWRMASPTAASAHAQTLAYGLRATALLYLSLELVRQICRAKGLAEAHFGWPPQGLALVRWHLRWAMLLGLCSMFVVAVVESPEFDIHRSPLGRLAFIGGLLVLAAFAHCVLNTKHGLLQSLAERHGVSWFWRQPRAWHLLAVSGPLALAVVAALGYFYTALELAWRLNATMWLLLGLLLAQAFAQRCLLVARRKLAIKQARDRRAAAMAHAGHGTHAAHAPVGEPVAGTAERPVDLITIDLQTRRLLRSLINVALFMGCWFIWIDVLPALGILNRYQLWTYTRTVQHSTTGAEVPINPLHIDWITLGDLLVSGLVLLMTVAAGRNLPGLLEIAFLQRLPMDPGGRYAITTVSRYAITLVGLAVAFWMIGIGWSNVQWLVAAMTVGLGFGLQEIFANFVSGLIILFERPMRVGDVVTIGGVSGAVTRIRIRATTITDENRKELIVPNKEFITGQLINWTLSDAILRMVIRVGVAYGSDISVVRRLLLQAAAEDDRVLLDPPTTAVLERFGDSTLDFELRIFVAGLDAFPDIRHDLNARIDSLFRESGIEMAFPQRDVHVRSIDAALGMPPRVAEQLKRAS
jgi:potassium efflux system protein